MGIAGFNTCTIMNSNSKYGRGGFTWYDCLSMVQDVQYKRSS